MTVYNFGCPGVDFLSVLCFFDSEEIGVGGLLLVPTFVTVFFTNDMTIPTTFTTRPTPPRRDGVVLPPPGSNGHPPVPPHVHQPRLSGTRTTRGLRSTCNCHCSSVLQLLGVNRDCNSVGATYLCTCLSNRPMRGILRLHRPTA